MALLNVNPMQHVNCWLLNRIALNPLRVHLMPVHTRVGVAWKSLVVEAKFRKRANARIESSKLRNRRLQKKYDGTSTKPRLSVFCSDKQLYAMLVDDVNKKCLYYGSTLQKSVRSDPDEAAKAVGEELVKAAVNLSIDEISSYDRNGSVRGERVKAFEIALSEHGFLLR
ncbi:uncharacterized protein LOC110712641 isoform X3 [Chenopodium quinoa]|uniref:uncharacterized protein LOC110712641 isoform X3 n=1 Tax=Chenopodium quinoa TaxID=63459 RepID=UPI000B77EDAF|nr:uncharacterized protein LOC110712641 isoform X3 [Chenopodium quinoa]